MEIKQARKKKPDGLSLPNKKFYNNEHNILKFNKIWKNYNEIQLIKKNT